MASPALLMDMAQAGMTMLGAPNSGGALSSSTSDDETPWWQKMIGDVLTVGGMVGAAYLNSENPNYGNSAYGMLPPTATVYSAQGAAAAAATGSGQQVSVPLPGAQGAYQVATILGQVNGRMVARTQTGAIVYADTGKEYAADGESTNTWLWVIGGIAVVGAAVFAVSKMR